MGNRTRHASGAVLLAGALALTACGVGSQSDSDATDAPAVTESSGTTADTTAATTADTTVTSEATGDTTTPAETTADTTADTEPPLADAIVIEAAIEASRDEGKLIIYGNPSVDQWTPLLAAFNEKYPWIQVETFDLGGAEAFQRYLSEEATGSPTADVIVNTDGAGWLDLVERGNVADYVDPELANLPPEDAVLAPGVYAMSYDPLISVFNIA